MQEIDNSEQNSVIKKDDIKIEENNGLCYDDSVSDEEIKQCINNIENGELTTNEIIFLKFMNNKETNISFSPRWEFMYELKPRIEVAKLLKLEYLTKSSWYDNILNATAKELKEILRMEQLKITGNRQDLVERVLANVDVSLLQEKFNVSKYILSNKGQKIIEKNKRLFMSAKEKAGKAFVELTNAEYDELVMFHKVKKYRELRYGELSFEKGYTKNDILWSIYNMQSLEYLNKKDYVMVSIVYDDMYSLLNNEKRYKQALDYLICCLYMRVYEVLPREENVCGTDYYRIQLKKYMKQLRNLLEKNKVNIIKFESRNDFITEYIQNAIKKHLSYWYEIEKVNKFQKKINEVLDA